MVATTWYKTRYYQLMISIWGKFFTVFFCFQCFVQRDSLGIESQYEVVAVIEYRGRLTPSGNSDGHYIWVISPSHSKNLLALVKVQILKPSGRVLPKWLHLCPSGFRKFTCVSAQIQRNIFKTCLLDGSRSRQSWGIPNFHDFWAAPGAIWSRLDGSKQETVWSIRNFGPCSTNS